MHKLPFNLKLKKIKTLSLLFSSSLCLFLFSRFSFFPLSRFFLFVSLSLFLNFFCLPVCFLLTRICSSMNMSTNSKTFIFSSPEIAGLNYNLRCLTTCAQWAPWSPSTGLVSSRGTARFSHSFHTLLGKTHKKNKRPWRFIFLSSIF